MRSYPYLGSVALCLVGALTACTDKVTAPEAELPGVSAARVPNASAQFVPHLGTVFDCGGGLLCRTGPGTPVVSTSGDQLTMAEWTTVTGQASLRCLNKGTQYVLHLSNLVPRGVYTIWNFFFVDGAFAGGGPLGLPDGSENIFRASASGEGQLSLIVEGGTPTPLGAPMPECVLADAIGTLLIAAYHMDGDTWDSGPGPASTQAFHAAAVVAGG